MSEAKEQEARREEPQRTASHEECYCMRARQAVSYFARLFEPPGEARRHFREARIEVLKGIRELIDYRIETLSRTNAKGARVTVE